MLFGPSQKDLRIQDLEKQLQKQKDLNKGLADRAECIRKKLVESNRKAENQQDIIAKMQLEGDKLAQATAGMDIGVLRKISSELVYARGEHPRGATIMALHKHAGRVVAAHLVGAEVDGHMLAVVAICLRHLSGEVATEEVVDTLDQILDSLDDDTCSEKEAEAAA